MKIHLGFILFFISLSFFASSVAERENRKIEETEEKRGINVDIETLNVQLQILTLLKQMKEQNNEIIKEISNGRKENAKGIKEIANGLKENTDEMKKITKQVSKNTEFIKDFTSKIKEVANGIKENTDEIKKISINIKDIGENKDNEKEVIIEIKKITNDIKRDTNGLKEIVSGVTESSENLGEIKDYFVPHARNCDGLRQAGDENSGIRAVYPYPGTPKKSVRVLCDQHTEGGGWTVFQVRENLPNRENFQRNWKNYSQGFGSLNGEFWMGLELMNVMTKLDAMELRIDLEDDTGEKKFAKYELFSVDGEDEKFKLNIGSYSGTAGDSLSYHNQRKFSTLDQNNDAGSSNCPVKYKGAWWYHSCHQSNLNGFPYVGNHSSNSNGINWHRFRGYYNSMVKTKMMFRTSKKIV